MGSICFLPRFTYITEYKIMELMSSVVPCAAHVHRIILFLFLFNPARYSTLPKRLVPKSQPICHLSYLNCQKVGKEMPNWELNKCCNHEQVLFLATLGVCTVVILALWRTILLLPFKLVTVFIHEASHAIACKLTCGHVEGIQIHADEGGSTETRGGVYWFILPAGCTFMTFLFELLPYCKSIYDLGSSFWGMVLVLASTNLLTARVAAGCLVVTVFVVLCVAKNWTLRWLCIGLILFLAVIWILQETTKIRILRYIILFIGVMNSLFSICDIYSDLISRRVHSSDAEKFAQVCPCPCTGVGWGVIWGLISFLFLSTATYLGLVILS